VASPDEKLYLHLAQGVRHARGLCETEALNTISAAGKWDWKATERWLKLTNPDRYERGITERMPQEDMGRLVIAMQEVLTEFVPNERLPEALGVLARRLVSPKAALVVDADPPLLETGS
jgi:hypothetical protein